MEAANGVKLLMEDERVDVGRTRGTETDPDLRGRPRCSSCIPTAAGGFGKVL